MNEQKKGLSEEELWIEVQRWREGFDNGLYGVVKDPAGERGFLSVNRDKGRRLWWPLGKGQNMAEAAEAAKALHEAIEKGIQDKEKLWSLGQEVRDFSQPIKAKK